MMEEMQIVQIANGASSMQLDDRKEFPYFLRTNPSDDLQVHFMVELLKKINDTVGSSVTAVNIIYTDGLYGRTAVKVCLQSQQQIIFE